ncbi:MAG: FKBP-type peptidyl-prolyl cis-trans isomerase [Myxococcota bacterium]
MRRLAFALALLPLACNEPEPIPAPDDVAAPPAEAITTDSGLAYRVLTEADGPKPAATDVVKVHYTGWTTDGAMFDSSVARGEPSTFGLNQVIPGWTEGLQLMSVGAKHRLWIPEDLAYKGMPGRPAGTLVFDVELLEIQ